MGAEVFEGVGGWIEHSSNAEPMLAAIMKENLCDWLCLQTKGGGNDQMNMNVLPNLRSALKSLGIKLFSWVTSTTDPIGDAHHINALKKQDLVDGAVPNCEDHFEYGHYGIEGFGRSQQFANALDPMPKLVSTYNFPSMWGFDFKAWAQKSAAFGPQAYTPSNRDWTPKAMVDDYYRVAQIIPGRWYRVLFTYQNLAHIRWVYAESFAASMVTIKDEGNRWGVPATKSVQYGIVPSKLRHVVNKKTGKVVGEFLGVASYKVVFPVLLTADERRESPAVLEQQVRDSRARGASIYLVERSQPEDYRALRRGLLGA